MKVIAIDPGKDAGVAVFVDCILQHAALANWDDSHAVFRAAARWQDSVDGVMCRGDVVCEVPQSYRMGAASRQSLLTLSFRAGYLVGLLRPEMFRLVTPQEWKGQTPKHIQQARTAAVLSTQEHDVLMRVMRDIPESKQHNVWDAVGIGLWHLRRR